MQIRTVKDAPVRMGIVGCGVVADYGHIPAVAQSAQAEIVAFADPDPARRDAQARKYDRPAYASFEEMAAAENLDAVTIATQPDVKLDLIGVAVEHGLHAFCEKPLCDTIEQAERIVRLMDEAGLFVGMAFVYRGQAVVQRMMQLLGEGAIGKLRVIRTENLWDYHGLRDQAARGERRHRALRNLGTLDCGVHHYDLVRYMAGADFASIDAVGTIVEAANVYPDHIIAHGRMTNGVLVYLEESGVWGYTAKDRPRYVHGYHMVGENGLLSSTAQGVASGDADLYVVSGGEQWTERVASEKAWHACYEQFFGIVLGREVPGRFLADGHDALANMRVCRDVIEQSMKT